MIKFTRYKWMSNRQIIKNILVEIRTQFNSLIGNNIQLKI